MSSQNKEDDNENNNNNLGAFATPLEAKRLQELNERFEQNYSEFKRKKTFEAPCMRSTLLTSDFKRSSFFFVADFYSISIIQNYLNILCTKK